MWLISSFAHILIHTKPHKGPSGPFLFAQNWALRTVPMRRARSLRVRRASLITHSTRRGWSFSWRGEPLRRSQRDSDRVQWDALIFIAGTVFARPTQSWEPTPWGRMGSKKRCKHTGRGFAPCYARSITFVFHVFPAWDMSRGYFFIYIYL